MNKFGVMIMTLFLTLMGVSGTSIAGERPVFKMEVGTKLEISMAGNIRDAVYKGKDRHGHRFESRGPTFWLASNHDIVRYETARGTVYPYSNVERGGLMAGGPGESWSINYSLSGEWREGRCEASSVNDRGYYTIQCNDKQRDKNFGITREIVVYAPTGMWISRTKKNDYSGERSAWTLTSPSIAVATASQ